MSREHRKMLREFAGQDVEDDAIDEELEELRARMGEKNGELVSLRSLLATREAELEELRADALAALEHLLWCRFCGEDSWSACGTDGARKADALLQQLRARHPQPQEPKP